MKPEIIICELHEIPTRMIVQLRRDGYTTLADGNMFYAWKNIECPFEIR